MAVRRVCARSTTGKCDGARTLRQLGRLARRVRAHPIPYRLHGERRLLDETALAGIAYWAGTGGQIGQLPAVVRAALKGDTRPLISAARLVGPLFSGSQAAPEGAPDLAVPASIFCNDFPTLWDRRAPISVRRRQFAARRARLDPSAFRPFSTRAWTSAIVDRGNSCIRWPDRHGPVQRTIGPVPRRARPDHLRRPRPQRAHRGGPPGRPPIPPCPGHRRAQRLARTRTRADRLRIVDHVRLHPQPTPRRHQLPGQHPARTGRLTRRPRHERRRASAPMTSPRATRTSAETAVAPRAFSLPACDPLEFRRADARAGTNLSVSGGPEFDVVGMHRDSARRCPRRCRRDTGRRWSSG